MFPLYFPPVAFQQTASMDSVATLAPQCFAKQVDLREEEGYNYVCSKYGREVFRRPGPCRSCRGDGKADCDCSKDKLDPSDVDVIAFQIQLYELGLDPDWIHRQVQYRGMESRERLRYELDGTEKFFCDGVPSNRILPTGFRQALSPKPPAQQVRSPPQLPPQHPASSTQQQHFNNKKQAPGGRRESNLRYVESAEKDDVLIRLGKMRLGDPEKDVVEPSGRRNNGRRRRGGRMQGRT